MSQINHESIDPLLLEKICLLYNIALDDLEFIVAMDNNFVYSFQKANKKYFLRGGTRHTSEHIHAELAWIQFLDSQGVKVSLPLHSKNGKYLERVEFGDKVISVVVSESAPGKQVAPNNPDEWNEQLWEEMGKTLGRMHSAAVVYNSKQPKFKRESAFE
ncbi:MAG: phosphotransferase, partial [Candidatus Heimdallarchaeota archaeon]